MARGRDWVAAGVGAGLCLGAAESLALHAQRVALAPGTALALVAADAACAGALAAPLALATMLARRRLPRSTVAGGVLGIVLLSPILSRVLWIASRSESFPGEWALLAAGTGLATLCGVGAALAGGRLEGAGVPISAPPLWAAVALLVAAGGALRDGTPLGLGPALWLGLVAIVVVLALCAALLAVVGARRDAVVPWPWGRTLFTLALTASAVAVAPRLLPWVFIEPPGRGPIERRPDVLVIALGEFAPSEGPALRTQTAGASHPLAPNLTVLAAGGLLYQRVLVPAEEQRDLAWLRIPGGLSLAGALRARGYRTRLAGEWTAPAPLPPGFARSDATESVEASARVTRATIGGALLAALGASRSRGTGGASAAARITAEARRRIVAAQARSDSVPLFLVVDYATVERRVAVLDAAVGAILDLLAGVGLEENARIAVTWSDAADGTIRVLLRPEPAARRVARGAIDDTPIRASDVAAMIGDVIAASPRGEAP